MERALFSAGLAIAGEGEGKHVLEREQCSIENRRERLARHEPQVRSALEPLSSRLVAAALSSLLAWPCKHLCARARRGRRGFVAPHRPPPRPPPPLSLSRRPLVGACCALERTGVRAPVRVALCLDRRLRSERVQRGRGAPQRRSSLAGAASLARAVASRGSRSPSSPSRTLAPPAAPAPAAAPSHVDQPVHPARASRRSVGQSARRAREQDGQRCVPPPHSSVGCTERADSLAPCSTERCARPPSAPSASLARPS